MKYPLPAEDDRGFRPLMIDLPLAKISVDGGLSRVGGMLTLAKISLSLSLSVGADFFSCRNLDWMGRLSSAGSFLMQTYRTSSSTAAL